MYQHPEDALVTAWSILNRITSLTLFKIVPFSGPIEQKNITGFVKFAKDHCDMIIRKSSTHVPKVIINLLIPELIHVRAG